MGCAIIIRSPHSFQDQVHSHPSFFSSRAIRDPFYFNQSHLSLLLYLNSLNPEDHGASSWILVFPHLNRILGQRVRDGGHPSAVNHIVVVLFWHHSVQIPESSFFFSQCNNWPKSQSLGVPNAPHGGIKFFLSCSLILMYFLRIGTIFMWFKIRKEQMSLPYPCPLATVPFLGKQTWQTQANTYLFHPVFTQIVVY